MPENRSTAKAFPYKSIYVSLDMVIPENSFMTHWPSLVKYPVNSALKVSLIHEMSKSDDYVVVEQEIWTIYLRRYAALHNTLIIRPRKYTIYPIKGVSSNRVNEFIDPSISGMLIFPFI